MPTVEPSTAPDGGARSLLTPQELADHLGYDVTQARATSAERVTWGWLKAATGLAVRPDPVPAEVFSWAVELAAIAYENPAAHADDGDGGGITTAYDRQRRAAILADAAAWAAARAGSSSPTGPQGAGFGSARAWPDPAEPCTWSRWP